MKTCTCHPSTNHFGTYQNCAKVLLPFPTERYPEPFTKPIDIDICILPEVFSLWQKGIQTVESCCGHNREQAYISVVESAVEKMLELGYEPIKDFEFKSKTI